MAAVEEAVEEAVVAEAAVGILAVVLEEATVGHRGWMVWQEVRIDHRNPPHTLCCAIESRLTTSRSRKCHQCSAARAPESCTQSPDSTHPSADTRHGSPRRLRWFL